MRAAAFELLACSSIGRYGRTAGQLALQVDSRLRSERTGQDIETILNHCHELWRAVLRAEQRGMEEFELAVLLSLLQEKASPRIDELYDFVAVNTRPTAGWLAAHARSLMRSRRTAQSPRFKGWSITQILATDMTADHGASTLLEKALHGIPFGPKAVNNEGANSQRLRAA